MPAIGDTTTAKQLGLKGSQRHTWHACLQCGRTRWVKLLHNKPVWEKCIFCSNQGEAHPNWKGGRRMVGRGYVGIWRRGSHPSCLITSYIYEHRLVTEAVLGRYLLPNEQVHHIDGNRTNNAPGNLKLFNSLSEHMKFHKSQKVELT